MSGGRLHDDFTQEPISEVPGQSCSGESVTNFSPAFHARSSARRNSLRAFSERSRGVSSVGRLSESPGRAWLQEMLQRMDPSSTRKARRRGAACTSVIRPLSANSGHPQRSIVYLKAVVRAGVVGKKTRDRIAAVSREVTKILLGI